jgi:drug/metabolite transporter (DMT)-like permease
MTAQAPHEKGHPMNATWPLLSGALASASFVAMDTTIKTLATRHDALELTFFRFASGSVFALLLWLRVRSPMPARDQWRMHALRCVLLLVSLVSYFHALTLLPLAQAVAMSYTAPIFVSLLAMLLLGERPSRWIWGAMAFGLAGVAVSLWPELRAAGQTGAAQRLEGMAAASLAALSFSGVMVLARHQAQRDSIWTILLLQNLMPAAVLAVPVVMTGSPVAPSDLGAIALVGAFATVGLLALTWAFTHLEASRVAPLEYTGFVWAGALGYLVLGEVPSAATITSALLIVGGCLLLLRR